MRFRPSLAASLTLGLLTAGFCTLGAWQADRAAQKRVLEDRFADHGRTAASRLPAEPQRLDRVRLDGRYDNAHPILVDNRMLKGRVGVHVLSPFTEAGSGRVLLVNRGWLPLPDRAVLPAVPMAPDTASLSGFLDLVRQPGLTVGAPERPAGDAWPLLVTYPDNEALGAALDQNLYPMALYLDAGAPGALAGLDWNPFPMPAARHRGYALTWFALAAACVAAWAILGVQRAGAVPP